MSSPKVAILILNWNGKEDTLSCLESVSKLTYSPLEIIVIDNGSTDDSVSAIRSQFPQYTLIETGQNLGFAEGNNVGIRLSLQKKYEWILLLNNDTQVAPDLIERFLETAAHYPRAGILGAKLLQFDQRDTLDHFGGLWNAQKGVFDLVGLGKQEHLWQEPQELDYICGAALFAKAQVFETVGLLEPRFFLIWEEADLCARAKKKGFKSISCPSARVFHKVSQSFTGGKPHTTYFWWRNRLLWIERNCSLKERLSLYLRVLLPETIHMLKLHMLKRLQLLFEERVRKKSSPQKRAFLCKNKAALLGIKDYIFRHFNSGSSHRLINKAK